MSETHYWNQILGVLDVALTRVADRLPRDNVKDIQESIDSGERGLALETLCTQLYEYDVDVDSDLVARTGAGWRSNASGSCLVARSSRAVTLP